MYVDEGIFRLIIGSILLIVGGILLGTISKGESEDHKKLEISRNVGISLIIVGLIPISHLIFSFMLSEYQKRSIKSPLFHESFIEVVHK